MNYFSLIMVYILNSFVSQLLIGKTPELTKIYQHNGVLSDKWVFHFAGDPVCNYIPKELDGKKIETGQLVTLSFIVPQASITHGKAYEAVKQLNQTECHPEYCVKIKHITAPVKGLEYSITLDLSKRGLEYQSFTSITGEKGIIFTFHSQEALKQVNTKTAATRIRRMAQASSAEKPTVVVDCGHGGRDPGFINDQVQEKEINWQIGEQVAQLLKKKGYDVCLTRNGDEYLALDERTAKIRSCNSPQALISIHTNAAHHPHISGIETFCHIPDLFNTHFVHTADQNLLQHAQTVDAALHNQSYQLAQLVHKKVVDCAKKQQPDVIDRKVKHKVTQLALGAEIPSVLVELGFLTHQKEQKLLQNKSYQRDLAQGICKGLDEFFNVL